MRTNDHISTLNQELLAGLAQSDKSIIGCAKEVNASLGKPELHDSSQTAGELRAAGFDEENCGMEGAGISVEDETGRVVHLRNITFPGRNCGFYLAGEIDRAFTRLNEEHPDDVQAISAALILTLGASHLFSDGNGRTAFGTAQINMWRGGLNGFNVSYLRRSKVERITQLMSDGTFFLLPQDYNPRDILANPYTYPNGSVINLPYIGDFSQASGAERSEIAQFVSAFAGSIVEYISGFNPKRLNDPVGRRIKGIAEAMNGGFKDKPGWIKKCF